MIPGDALGHLAIGVGGAVLAIGYWWTSRDLSFGSWEAPGPRLFPNLVAVGLLAVSLLVVVQSLGPTLRLLRHRAGAQAPSRQEGRHAVLLFSVLIVGYGVGLYTIGFTISSMLAAYFLATAMGSSLGWKGRVVYAVSLVVVLECVFTLIFNIPFPGGLIGALL